MRVDKNWEDAIGKRLHDFEGDLSPQAWDNINKRIKPSRSKRFLWLPALLFFLALPGALYFIGMLPFKHTGSHELAGHAGKHGLEKQATETSNASSNQVQNHEATQAIDAKSLGENGILPRQKTANGPATAATIISNPTTYEQQEKSENRPEKTNTIALTIAGSHPTRPISSEEKTERKKHKRSEKGPGITRMFNANSENRHAGALAFNRVKKSVWKKENAQPVANYTSKTQLFGDEKPKDPSASETLNPVSGTAKTGTVPLVNQEKPGLLEGKHAAATDPQKPATPKMESALKTSETLPDTAKKQLPAALPEIAKQDEKTSEKKPAKPEKSWAFSVYGAPQYAFQRVQPNQQDEIRILKMDNKNTFEAERFGYEFGIRASYPVLENLQLIFGFQAAQLNQHLLLTRVSNLADSAVAVQQGNTITMQVYYRRQSEKHLFRYFFGGIFTGFNLTVMEKLDLSGGLGMNWLLQTKTANENSNLPTSAFNPFLSLGLQYTLPLSEELSLKAGPNLQYYLKPVQENQAFVVIKPATFGFSVGLQYKP